MLLEEFWVPGRGSRQICMFRLQCDACDSKFERLAGPRQRKQSAHFCDRKCSSRHQSQSAAFSHAIVAAASKRRADPVRRQAYATLNSQRMRHLYATRPEIQLKQREARKKRWQDPEYRKSRSGENHPLSGKATSWWQPWKERDVEGRTWVVQIKRLFGNRCALCGSRKELHAHHIIPKAIQPDLIHDLNNGLALCHYCHDGKENSQNVHRLLREDPVRYSELMQQLLLKRTNGSGDDLRS